MTKEIQVKDKKFEEYINRTVILNRVAELSEQISKDYQGKTPIFIAILNGSFFFAADLLKNIKLDCEVSFVKLASYKGVESSGKVKILIGLMKSLKNRHVVIIEDIIDSGVTISQMKSLLSEQEPLSVSIVTLLFKKEALKIPVEPEYRGFEVGNTFLVGYGLDYDEYGRNLPDIYIEKT